MAVEAATIGTLEPIGSWISNVVSINLRRGQLANSSAHLTKLPYYSQDTKVGQISKPELVLVAGRLAAVELGLVIVKLGFIRYDSEQN